MELRELEQLEAATVPGPWKVIPARWSGGWGVCVGSGSTNKILLRFVGHGRMSQKEGDAAFVAATRNALPDLLRLARAAKMWYDTSEALRAFVEDGRVSSADDDMYAEFSSASEALAEVIRELYL